jgi:hypothetical protein
MKTFIKDFLVKYRLIIVFGVVCVFFFLRFFAMIGDSATVDEKAHIPAGYSYLKLGDYRLNPEHPPLVKALSGFSLMSREFFADKSFVFPDGQDFWQTENNPQWQAGDVFLYEMGNDADEILLWSRLPILFLGMLTLVYLFFVVEKYTHSTMVALMSMILFAFSPNILAHSGYVTTDMGATLGFLLSVDLWVNFIQKKTWMSFILFCLGFSVAILLKFSVILLIPIFGIFWLIYNISQDYPFHMWAKQTLGTGLVGVLVFLSILFVVVSLVYVGFMYNMPVEVQVDNIKAALYENNPAGDISREVLVWMAQNPVLRYFGYFLTGIAMVSKRVVGGNVVFLLGEIRNGSFWYYFPMSFLLKESLAYIVLLVSVMIFGIGDIWMNHKNLKWKSLVNQYPFEIVLFLVVCVYWWSSIGGNLNLGIRHILPVLPLMYVLVSILSLRMWRKMNVRYEILGVLLVWYISMPFMIYPSFMSYTNEMVGGQDNGYLVFTDSNLDWGQDLKRLANWTKDKEVSKIYVDYFGGGNPEYYLGNRYTLLSTDMDDVSGYVSVSATYFQNSFYIAKTENKQSYEWLKKYTPVEVLGGSMLIYDIK